VARRPKAFVRAAVQEKCSESGFERRCDAACG
jgi:hypothetical protein